MGKGKIMREKLIELLETVANPLDITVYGEVCVTTSQVADHLIANGVTIPKWIPVTGRLPENDGRYLVRKKCFNTFWYDVYGFAKDGRKVDEYDFEREWENVWYRYDSEYGYVTTDSVTHWMPIPTPPKEE